MHQRRLLTAIAMVGVLGLSACGGGGGGGHSKSLAEGTARLASPHGEETVRVHAVKNDDTVTGTIKVSSQQAQPYSVEVHCAVEREGALMIGGTARGGSKDGSHVAAIIRQGAPDRMVMWAEDPPPADTCAAFLAAIPPGLVADLQPIHGDIRTS